MTARRIFLFLVTATSVRAGDWYDQLWPEANIYIQTGQHSRIFLLAAGTRTKQEGYTDGQFGVHMDFYFAPIFDARAERHPDIARHKFLMIRAGYLFGRTPKDSPSPFTEHTGVIEMTPRYFLPKQILISDRNRGDIRFLDGAFVPRYRNRLKVERTFAIGKRSLTPYAHAETFYDWRYNSFHRQRYAAGAEFEVNKRLVLEGYVLRQHDSQSSVTTMNVVGVALQLYLR